MYIQLIVRVGSKIHRMQTELSFFTLILTLILYELVIGWGKVSLEATFASLGKFYQ